jgi:hypothetical protein
VETKSKTPRKRDRGGSRGGETSGGLNGGSGRQRRAVNRGENIRDSQERY